MQQEQCHPRAGTGAHPAGADWPHPTCPFLLAPMLPQAGSPKADQVLSLSREGPPRGSFHLTTQQWQVTCALGTCCPEESAWTADLTTWSWSPRAPTGCRLPLVQQHRAPPGLPAWRMAWAYYKGHSLAQQPTHPTYQSRPHPKATQAKTEDPGTSSSLGSGGWHSQGMSASFLSCRSISARAAPSRSFWGGSSCCSRRQWERWGC